MNRKNSIDTKDTKKYNPTLIEKKWQKDWEKNKIYSPNLDSSKNPFYNLMMFPYPSADGMHVGNMYAFTGADIYGRYMRMKGFDVFEPIGLDGFGIHSENYAIKIGRHPKEQAKISEENFYRQLRSIGNGFDWTRTVETYKPEYYKWTQWIFIQLFKAGLAYRKKAPVNFCPSCKTVLADEQVISRSHVVARTSTSDKRQATSNKIEVNVCERCETEVVKKELEQWFFKITKYADRLLNNLSHIDWVEKVKITQKNWIGKKEGALIRFKIKDLRFKNEEVEVFTTRADTLYGATFLVLAPEHPIVASLLNSKFNPPNRRTKLTEIKNYIQKSKAKSDAERIENKEKTGVFSGLHAINPLNQEKIPIWIADYAIMGYGTGALFGDAHDERDVEFANKYGIALKPTLITGNRERDKRIMDLKECFTGEGILVDSAEFSGLTSVEAKKKIVAWLSKKGDAHVQTTYHLRDWLISRQRYWGPPIPMIYCKICGWQPVSEKDLPVELPFIEDYKPLGTGKAPLASHPEFYKTKCPKCGGAAKRETDVSDTFLDSSWYFLRYLATEFDTIPFPSKDIKILRYKDTKKEKALNILISRYPNISQRLKWLPVDMYIGGAEHSVLHLLYSRFITMALKDLGFINFEEPFSKFYAHGLIIRGGAKMSKSKGNVVVPDEYIKKYGADALRCYLMFLGPFSQGGDFSDSGLEGMHRFLKRIWSLVVSRWSKALDQRPKTKDELRMMHKAIKRVTEDVEGLRYNTAIAGLMEYYNFLSDKKEISEEEIKMLLLLLAPFAPYVTEELFQGIRNDQKGTHNSIHVQAWPTFDSKFLTEDEITIVIAVNGKVRDTIKVSAKGGSASGGKSEKLKVKSYIEQLAKESDKIKKYLDGKKIIKVIYVEGKIINFVTE